MKVTAESTSKLVTLLSERTCAHCRGRGEVPARLWKATTESGVECFLFVTRVVVAEGEDQSQFQRELSEQAAPTPEMEAIPLRLVL